MKSLSGGTTNKLYKVEALNHKLLVRINGAGTENLLNREREVKSMKVLSRCGEGSKVFCTFCNGIIYEFKPGKPLKAEGNTI